MKLPQITTLLLSLLLLVRCTDSSLQNEIKEKESQIDSLEQELTLLKQKEQENTQDTITQKATEEIPENGAEQKVETLSTERLSGKHNLTLQWISWEQPGKINFVPLGENKYKVDGFQQEKKLDECPECYLKVNGVIEEINPKKLLFTGKIESSVYHLENGRPHIIEGTFEFLSTKNRRYWRCQNMEGLDGVTNYVDIYF